MTCLGSPPAPAAVRAPLSAVVPYNRSEDCLAGRVTCTLGVPESTPVLGRQVYLGYPDGAWAESFTSTEIPGVSYPVASLSW